MINPKSRKHLYIARLTEMRLYYIHCAENSMPGGRAWEKFQSYVEALDAAIAEMSGTEGEGDG